MPSGALNYRFTINNPFNTDKPLCFFESWPDVEYLVASIECGGEEKTVHWQGYVKLKVKHDLRWLSRNCCGYAWFGVASYPKYAEAYARKTTTHVYGPVEIGVKPIHGQGRRSDLEVVAERVMAGDEIADIAVEHPATCIRNYRGLEWFRNLVAPIPVEPPIVHVLYGETRSGKTEYGKRLGGTFKLVPWGTKTWFGSYLNQNILILNEFKGQGEWTIGFMCEFLEQREVDLPTKGGFVKNRATHIVLTSNVNPRFWYPDASKEEKLALFERFHFCFVVRGKWRDGTSTFQKDSMRFDDLRFNDFSRLIW